MALREVNLIPAEILFRRQAARHLSVWLCSMGLGIVTILGAYLLDTQVLLAQKRSILNLNDIHTNLGTRTEQINRLHTELENLHQRKVVLGSIRRNHPYSSVLLTLADVMDEHIWLTELSVSNGGESEKAARVEMSGLVVSHEDLGNFLTGLSRTLFFQKVALKFVGETDQTLTNENKEGAARLMRFEIACEFSGV